MAKKLYTIDGIAVKLDERIFSDYRLAEMSIKLSEKAPDETDEHYEEIMREKGQMSQKLISFVLGSEKDKVLDALAAKNDGFVSTEDLFEWVSKLINSNSTAKK